MSLGKPINKKSYYGSEGVADIAMPPLNEPAPISSAAPDPWVQEFAEPQQNVAAPVPDHVPQDVLDEMEQSEEQEQEVEQTPQQQPVRDTSRESNLRVMREAREKAERERDELYRLLVQQQQNPKQPEPEYVDDLDIDADALVEGKNLKKVNQKMSAMEQQLRNYQEQSASAITEARIRAQFPDFEKVVSAENVEILNATNPEIAKILRDTTDLYSKAASAYKVIKQFGIHKDEVIDHDRIRAMKNIVKPKPLASVNPQQGDSPLSKANAFANGEFTPEMKEKLRREMMAARKGL